MSAAGADLANLVLRQAAETSTPACGGVNGYDGRLGLRISSVFVIFVGSAFGALFPVVSRHHPGIKIPDWAFFFTKYFGSGVIIATAFIHLLSPANSALTDPCLTGSITQYPWAQGISMISVFSIFFVELLAMRLANFSPIGHAHDHDVMPATKESDADADADSGTPQALDPESLNTIEKGDKEYAAQLLAIFILEFGIIFHSIFIGLTLAVSGAEFTTLYIVLVFHQTFEGLGLGSRLATTVFPNKWTPYLMGMGYGVSTPIAIAIGLGVRTTFDPASQTALMMNGIFDAISSGILLYTGLVELMAHEFLFGRAMMNDSLGKILWAFGSMVLGAGLMALLGKWA